MKSLFKTSLLLDLGLVFLCGLLPLLWFIPEHFILSVDSNLPFTWERWINEVFYSWDTHIRAGWSPRMIESTHFFFFVQWFFQYLGLDLLAAQRGVFVFWFLLPGITQFFFLRYLFREFPETAKRLACFAGVLFYMFNLYLEPIWLGLNVSNLLGYAFLPLLMRIWLQVLEERRSPVLYGFIFALVSLMASGIATNPANVFVSVIPFFVLTLIVLFRSFKERKGGVIHLILFLFFTCLFTGLFNLYWVLTEWQKVFVSSFNTTKEAGQGFIVTSWLEGISKHASFSNVIRMLGSWTWFAEPRSYNSVILHNPLFVLLSWLVPLFGLLGLWVKTRYRSIFGTILVLGIVLSMGIHFPFKNTYMWMVEHIPFFWLVRSPWYKFMVLTCLGYSYFFGVAAARLYQWGKVKGGQSIRLKRLAWSLCALLILLPPIYAYPVSLGQMFLKPNESSYPNHFKVPEYAYEAGEYLNQKPGNNRIWVFTGKGFFINQWGFGGFTPFLPYVVSKPILFADHNLSIPISQQWLSAISHPFQIFQNSFEQKLSSNLYRCLSLFNVDTLVVEKDFRWAALPVPYSLEKMESSLAVLKGVKLEKSFGQWDIYHMENPHPLLYGAHSVIYVEDHIDALIPLSNTDLLNQNALFFAEDMSDKNKSFLWEEDHLDQVVLFDKSWFDLAVDLMEPNAQLLIKAEEGKTLPVEFEVAENGFYLFYASKERAVSWTTPRSLIDREDLPHSIPLSWSPNLLEKENWLSVNQAQVKPILFDGRYEKELGQGLKWEAIGQLYLEKGVQKIQLEGWQPEKGKITVRVASKEESNSAFDKVKNLIQKSDKRIAQFIVTDPAWNYAGWSSTDPNKIKESSDIKWQKEGSLKEAFSFQNSSQWSRLEPEQVELRIWNTQDREKTVRLAFKVLSVQPHQREIYVHLNRKKVRTLKIEPLTETGTSLLLTLKPGENEVFFQTNGSKEPLNKYYSDEDDRGVIMLFKQIKVGDLSFYSEVYLPQRDSFTFRVYPFNQKHDKDPEFSQPTDRFIQVGSQKIALLLREDEQGAYYWESEPVKGLKPGKNELQFLEKEGQSYFIDIRSAMTTSLEPLKSMKVSFERKNPTLIEGTLQSEKPEWLIFSESFDSRWELSLNGKIYTPVKVNSFANAYFIPSTSGKELSFSLEFLPQKWMWKGIKISLGSLIGASLFVLLLSIFKARYRRQQKN